MKPGPRLTAVGHDGLSLPLNVEVAALGFGATWSPTTAMSPGCLPAGRGMVSGDPGRRTASLTRMETTPPGRSTGQEIAARVAEAALGCVPLAGNALAVTFVTALSWRLEQQREQWFTELAVGVEELRQQVDWLDLDALVDDDRSTDAMVSATRTVEHTHQAEKIEALRNAVLNSAVPGAPRRGHSGDHSEPGRQVHGIAPAPGNALGRPARMVRITRPPPANVNGQ